MRKIMEIIKKLFSEIIIKQLHCLEVKMEKETKEEGEEKK